jgi:transglutaminase-like putative cysteine protease
MLIRIDYTTTYDYAQPAHSVVQLLRLTPRSGDDQQVKRWRIDVDADGALRTGCDAFGNATHLFSADGPLRRLVLTVAGEVETGDAAGVVRGFPEPLAPMMFLRSTPLTALSPALSAFAHTLAGDALLDRLHTLNGGIHARMAFDPDATGTGTDAAGAFAQGRGVCQDYAHIFCAAARALDVPARYVSGHFVRSDGVAVQPAGHAWVEALVPDLGWVGFDPTHGISVTPAHVRVAVGLDYLDAAPVRGARRGGGTEALSVSVRAVELARQLQSQGQQSRGQPALQGQQSRGQNQS